MKKPRHPNSLATRVQVRQILNAEAEKHGRSVSKQRMHALEDTDDFPAPFDVLEDGQGRPLPIWKRAEIVHYAETRSTAAGRPPVHVDDQNG